MMALASVSEIIWVSNYSHINGPIYSIYSASAGDEISVVTMETVDIVTEMAREVGDAIDMTGATLLMEKQR